ncbi:ketoacyl-ACP synthase III family protein [Streptomyces sp. SP18CS02]|uniref:ketoacyl-ACP synthase III family protein n=1 Tax=Streptomyces sp. SP18CS02 TaxID=3002531 RepID=UPI002E77BD36|nr:ketoacyl-ACP synthase III family protein [Streptomyces sp. SP18CS02]MEE1756449.1 ketoacyl-ACP synthase III family protein [Streptomyces sp. SP18CS02]
MRYDNLYIRGLGAELGTLVPVEDAVRNGLYRPEVAAQTEMRSASVSELSGPDLAVRAGRKALEPLGLMDSRVGLHLHVGMYYQGIDMWSASCYVLNQLLGAGPMLSGQFTAMSNGSMAALELAAGVLSGRPDLETALITVGDRWGEPGFPHWGSDIGAVFGDAGSAAVLGTEPGPVRIVSTASYTDPALESMHRGDEPFRRASPAATTPINLHDRKVAYLAANGGVDEFDQRNAFGMGQSVELALKDAGSTIDDMRWVLVPFFGRKLVRTQCLEPLGIPEDRTLADWGLSLGHLGGSDQLIGLDHLLATGAVAPGDRVLQVGVGLGFTWTTAVVEITDLAAA